MTTGRSETQLAPDLKAAVPAVLFRSGVGAAVVAGAVWLLIDAIDTDLAAYVFVGLTIVFGGIAVGNLQSREYVFQDEHLELREGFLTVTQETVPYERVTDVGLSRSVWQRVCNVGTITVNTAGRDRDEVTISYVKEPESVYDTVSSLIGDNLR